MTPIFLISIGILAALVAFVVVYAIGIYNGLVSLRNRFKNAFAQIDVQLKRRYDLIPNLVEVAKGYLAHERGTLDEVVAARGAAVSAGQKAAADPTDPVAMKALSGAESQLAGAMSRLMVVVEAYPNLKGNETMMQLTEELTSTENKVSFARQAYNDAVMQYNTAREVFPAVIVANNCGFQAAELFEITNVQERDAPKVKFT
jgi:LemA protein